MSEDNQTLKSCRNALWVIAGSWVVYTVAQYIVLIAAVIAGRSL